VLSPFFVCTLQNWYPIGSFVNFREANMKPDLRLRFLAPTAAAYVVAVSVLFNVNAICLGQANDASTPTDQQHDPKLATTQFDVHPELNVTLFAAEPFLANPSNIDIDHLGRVWVCEVMNYRQKIANGDIPERTEGDRIIVIEDSNGDGQANETHVFYQGRDIDSAHGICVLGNRVIVSANDSVFYLIDDDGDLKSDRKEVLFTGIGGVQHDHGIHAFVFGPDGKLYFNFGNEGKQICDAQGKIIVDRAGNEVKDSVSPYQQGMVFRCNLDGSEFETLAWNFRNNWEVCVDSFGTLWQSDNDDDGNRATRINYVMPYGNYGYRDEFTGHGWRAERTGMHSDIPLKHWHLNDPGVMPNLLQTGAGSPTGICIYEGDALPDVFKNQVIHCDAGPNIVRSYPVAKDGAGYSAKIVNMVDGASKNQWFRPSDVCVAPDGSLIIADWYDPGVGGHRMRDIERGRLFRVTGKNADAKYSFDDELSDETAMDWLKSPNQARRYMAYQKIKESKSESVIGALNGVWADDPNPRFRARAMWLLGDTMDSAEQLDAIVEAGLKDANADIRIATIRLCRHLRSKLDWNTQLKKFSFTDPDPQVRRELLVSLREMQREIQPDELVKKWTELAIGYDSGDRWYLEALGIAAADQWDACLQSLKSIRTSDEISPEAYRDIVWRSRGNQSPELLAEIISDNQVSASEVVRYYRAFDFLKLLKMENVESTLRDLAFSQPEMNEKARVLFRESTNRIRFGSLNAEQKSKVKEIMSTCDDGDFVALAVKLGNETHDLKLIQLADSRAAEQIGADAMKALMRRDKLGQVQEELKKSDDERFLKFVDVLVRCGHRKSCWVLAGYMEDKTNPIERRLLAVRALGKTNAGAGDLLWRVENKKIDVDLEPAVAATLHSVPWGYIRDKATDYFSLPPSKESKPLPTIADLSQRKGDAKNGAVVFAGTGTCAKCHIVNKVGDEIGPDLSEIGAKLSREAMFESILFPSAGISHNYENWLVLKESGDVISGLLLNKTDAQTTIKDTNGVVHNILSDDIDEQKKLALSLMPADLHREFGEQDLVDLVEYLLTLKKAK
jgi:putative membrane-bound dehydrogenase-like protein